MAFDTGWSGLDRTIGLPVVGGAGDRRGARQRDRDLHPEDVLDVALVEADLLVGPVQHEVPVAGDQVEQVEGLDGDLGVLDRRDVERGHDDALVGLVEGAEHLVVEAGRRVDDDEVEVATQGLDRRDAPARR